MAQMTAQTKTGSIDTPTAQDHIANRQQVLDFLGVSTCKLTFRRWRPKALKGEAYVGGLRTSNSTLSFIDFGESRPCIRDLGSIRPFAGIIHPNGQKAVFSSSFAASDLFVQPLREDASPVKVGVGAYPSWWTDPTTGHDYVVYRTQCESSKTEHIGKTVRLRIDPHTNQPMGKPQLVYAQGFCAGLSRDGRWLGTAIHWLTVVDLQTGRTYHPINHEQACNPTMAPNNSGRIMTLRIPHDLFAIIRYDGTGQVWYQKPEGTVEWQTPKWSNHLNFATAVAARDDLSYDIYLIRLSDHKSMKLVWGDSYAHPHLWCDMEAD